MATPYADSIASSATARIRTGAADTTAADLRAVFSQVGAAVAFLEGLSRGAKILKGNGAPNNADGLAGDAYVDLLTGDLHFKEGTWAFQLSLKGAPGYTPRKNIDYRDGYTPQKGVDYRDGNDGKSAYQIWRDAGNTGNEAAFLASLKATDGGRGAQITSSESAPVPALTNQAGDVHFQTLSNERFRVFVFGADWQAIYTTPPGATILDGSITDTKLADSIKIGSLASARVAFPIGVRSILLKVEDFFVWIGGAFTDVYQRLTNQDGIISSVSQTVGTLGQTVSNNTGRITALEARPIGSTGTGTGTGSGTANYPAQSTATVGKFLKSTGAAGGEVWDTAGGAAIELALNLTSNSDTKAPSVSAVVAAIPAKATPADVTAGASDSKYVTPKGLADSSQGLDVYLLDIPAQTKSDVSNNANWSASNRYVGPAIPNGMAFKVYYIYPAADDPATPGYKFEFLPNNKVIRIKTTHN